MQEEISTPITPTQPLMGAACSCARGPNCTICGYFYTFVFGGNSVLSTVCFSTLGILETLKNVIINKGAGPDNIPSFLNYCRTTLAPPITPPTFIFNSSVQQGIFPDVLKIGHIVPILKSENPSDVKNYSPITILPSIGKVFETLVLSRLKPFLRPLTSPCQTRHHYCTIYGHKPNVI